MISYIIDKLFKIISAIKELLVGKPSIEDEKTNYNFDGIRNTKSPKIFKTYRLVKDKNIKRDNKLRELRAKRRGK